LSRFLFVVPPLTGHHHPTAAVGAELRLRGHDVAWVGSPEFLRARLPAGAAVLPAGEPQLYRQLDAQWSTRGGARGAEALKLLWEDFLVPLAEGTLAGVAAAVDAFRPDVVVADQQALAGALVARHRGLAWATSASTSAELVSPVPRLPLVEAWLQGCLARLRARAAELLGGGPAGDGSAGGGPAEDERCSPHRVVHFTTPALIGPIEALPAQHVFVGPAMGGRPDSAPFPWARLREGDRRVLVSMGTVNTVTVGRFLQVAIAALGAGVERVQAVVVVPPGVRLEVPAGVIAVPHVPQLRLLPHLDAVVCHAGQNTVTEALAHGLPLVVAPIRHDQPINAQQVVAAGAGVRVPYARARPDDVRAAVRAVLDDPAHRASARRVQGSFAAAGGAPAAADHLEKLA